MHLCIGARIYACIRTHTTFECKLPRPWKMHTCTNTYLFNNCIKQANNCACMQKFDIFTHSHLHTIRKETVPHTLAYAYIFLFFQLYTYELAHIHTQHGRTHTYMHTSKPIHLHKYIFAGIPEHICVDIKLCIFIHSHTYAWKMYIYLCIWIYITHTYIHFSI